MSAGADMARSVEDVLRDRLGDRGKIDAEKTRLLALVAEQEHTEHKEKD